VLVCWDVETVDFAHRTHGGETAPCRHDLAARSIAVGPISGYLGLLQ
jgi:hypothetical protein